MAHCPAYSGPDLLAVLLARNPLPRLLQAACAHFDSRPRSLFGRILPDWVDAPAQHRCRALSRHPAAVQRGDRLGAAADLSPGLARYRDSQGDPALDAVERVLHPHDHRRRRRLAVRAGAGQPPRRRGGDQPPDRPADERNRGAQAHRRQAAEGQGGRGSRQQGEEPPRRRAQPRAAHAAQRHPRLCAAARARPGDSAAAHRGDQGRPPQRRASVRPDRRAARHLQDRGRPLPSQPQRGPHRRLPRPDRRHVPPAGDRQGHRVPLYPLEPCCPPWSTPTRTGCGRS